MKVILINLVIFILSTILLYVLIGWLGYNFNFLSSFNRVQILLFVLLSLYITFIVKTILYFRNL